MNGPPTTETGTPVETLSPNGSAAVCCCSRAEEMVRGLHGASGGGVRPLADKAVPAARNWLSIMPCWGLDAMLDGRLSIGGCFTTTFMAAVVAAVI
jgi:hypothetical protein